MMKSAGSHIRQRREAVGLSQASLAAQIGVDKSFLSLVESGRRAPSEEQVERLSAILGVPPELLALEAGRFPVDVRDAIARDAAQVAAAVRERAQQCAVVYPVRPDFEPRKQRGPVLMESGDIPPVIQVSKASTIYRAHSYHTKVPPTAIAPFIEAFTQAGDVVSDPFCGSGMTGVAALDLGRNALLSDVSPAAVHIARNYTAPCDPDQFRAALAEVERRVRPTMDWLYRPVGYGGRQIEYTVWSDLYACSACTREISYWAALHAGNQKVPVCPQCGAKLDKKSLNWLGELPVRTHVSEPGKKMAAHSPTRAEADLIAEVDATAIPYWIPSLEFGRDREMWRSAHGAMGIDNAADFYTTRNLHALSALRHAIVTVSEGRLREALLFAFTACVNRASKRYQWNAKRPTNVMTGTMYVSSLRYEWNVMSLFRRKAADVVRFYEARGNTDGSAQVFQSSATQLEFIPDGSVDMVFMDPPFGSNIFYADSSLLWDAWLGTQTDQANEIVVNRKRSRANGGKDLDLYGDLMTDALSEASRVLRRGGRGVIAFSNTDAGFETRSVHILDKGQPSIKGVKGQLGKERVTRLDLTLTLAHRSQRPATRSKVTQAFLDEAILRALASGVNAADHVYTAVLRDVLQEGFSATGITIDAVGKRRAELCGSAEVLADG